MFFGNDFGFGEFDAAPAAPVSSVVVPRHLLELGFEFEGQASDNGYYDESEDGYYDESADAFEELASLGFEFTAHGTASSAPTVNAGPLAALGFEFNQ